MTKNQRGGGSVKEVRCLVCNHLLKRRRYRKAGMGPVCGEDIALGAMYACPSLSPEERIRTALEAAEQFSAGVRRPFIVKKLEVDK
jgi:hypothetical protein